MKISKRMKLLVSYVKDNTAVYDLCCDNGNFGILAYQLKKSKKIHFVDSVESIVKRLELKAAAHLSGDAEVNFTVADARKIVLEDDSSIILAGVGDHLGAEIIDNIIDSSKKQRWIISLQKFNVQTRKVLHKHNVSMVADVLFKEKTRFRELIVFDTGSESNDKVPLIPPYVQSAKSEDEISYAKLFREFQ